LIELAWITTEQMGKDCNRAKGHGLQIRASEVKAQGRKGEREQG
jgi:hypothetical protein